MSTVDVFALKSVPARPNEVPAVGKLPLQETSLDIWDKKYRLKTKDGQNVDETVQDTFKRVARALADTEHTDEERELWYGEFLWALEQGAVPAGRITSNAGALDHKPATSTINCTVSGTITDSMDDILGKVHEAGLTLKAGCGIGYDFSTLRPRGAYVSGAGAYTSGPLSFMDIFDKMCFTVSSAGGRRGAQMGTFDVRHPDVLEFIKAKREDGRLRQFNLSLLITEDFIQAVKADEQWQLAFPIRQKELDDGEIELHNPDQIVWRDWPSHDNVVANDEGLVACRIYRTLPARRLWDLIMASTYDFAEPGFILIDKVNEMNNNWFDESIRATNPCVTPSTWVQTSNGPRQVRDLIGAQFNATVDGETHLSGPQGFFKTATKDIVTLSTTEGHSLQLTADHKVRRVSSFTRYTTDTQWCAAGELKAGDRVLLNDHRANAEWDGALNENEGYLLGLLIGDGTVKSDKTVLSVWAQQAQANGCGNELTAGVAAIMEYAEQAARSLSHSSDFAGWMKVSGRGEYRLATSALQALANQVPMLPGDKSISPELEKASSSAYKGFLRGFFDADGSVQGTQDKGISVRLAQSDLPRLEAVQRMLLRLGINSSIDQNRREAGSSLLPNGKGDQTMYATKYATKAQHELIISGENLARFCSVVGFADTDKQKLLESLLGNYKRELNRERFVARVASVEPAGISDVYDVQIPGINTFDANGLHAHNCGEQPLPPYGACLLGSINLTRFVVDPFTDNARFDWDRFTRTVEIFTRMLDNVVEINGLPLEQQRAEIQRKRRHGMGYLGLGSSLTLMGLKYGSAKSLEFTEKVTRELAVAGWRTALKLSKEKGPAPIMEETFGVTAEMLRKRPEMKDDGYKVGDLVSGRVLHARYSRYMQRIAEIEPELVKQLAEHGARFTHHSSIAPTGTISLSLANNASNGIEPSFAHHYSRNVIREGRKSKEKVDVFSFELLAYQSLINEKAMPYSEDADEQLPDYFMAADDISPKDHVAVQAAAQRWIDSSISKTANVPTDFAFEEFKDIYMYAYDQGLKGCTTFRFNPENFQGVLVKEQDLENTEYQFTLDDGSVVSVKGNEQIEYDGEMHTAANLYDALKEGYYGKF
ncbi:MAG: LAGLIDADG family homing endonuclease [Granulosicoccus sp.]